MDPVATPEPMPLTTSTVPTRSTSATITTTPAADRGLTTDDVADVALEEAGLTHTARPRVGDSRPGPKPRIGDSRPAPAGAAASGERDVER